MSIYYLCWNETERNETVNAVFLESCALLPFRFYGFLCKPNGIVLNDIGNVFLTRTVCIYTHVHLLYIHICTSCTCTCILMYMYMYITCMGRYNVHISEFRTQYIDHTHITTMYMLHKQRFQGNLTHIVDSKWLQLPSIQYHTIIFRAIAYTFTHAHCVCVCYIQCMCNTCTCIIYVIYVPQCVPCSCSVWSLFFSVKAAICQTERVLSPSLLPSSQHGPCTCTG